MIKVADIVSGDYTKADFGEIEPETYTTTTFYDETFFSLFAENAQLYDLIFDNLKAQNNSGAGSTEEGEKSQVEIDLRMLRYMLRRPTPVRSIPIVEHEDHEVETLTPNFL